MPGSTGSAARPGTLTTLGARIVNFSGVLAVGTGLGMVLAIIRIAVLTRLLDMPVYGQLTLLVILAGLVMISSRILIVTGTLLTAFKGGDDDGGEEEEAFADDQVSRESARSDDPSRVLGTGLVAALLLTALLTAIATILGPQISELLIDVDGRTVISAAVALGGLDATYHLLATIQRYERRPGLFVTLQMLHAAFGLLGATMLIAAGYGLEGAIWGLALGTALAAIPATWLARHRFSLHLSAEHLRALIKKGSPFIFITGGFWLYRHTDIFIVSRYLPEADVALYRAAGRIGAIGSSILGAVLLARGPLMRGPLRGALHREGLLVTADARIVHYMWVLSLWLLVGMLLTRDLLIRVAPPEYESASILIPILGLAALSTTALTVVFRTSRLKRKKPLLIPLLLTMSPALVLMTIFLVPRYGLEGAAVSAMAPPIAASALFLAISQRTGPQPLELPWRLMILGVIVAASYGGAMLAVTSLLGGTGDALGWVAAILFPGALILTGALPRDEVDGFKRLFQVIRAPNDDWIDRLSNLDGRQIELLKGFLRDDASAPVMADRFEGSEPDILGEFVRALRDIGEIGQVQPKVDAVVGEYIVSSKNVGQRDREGQRLVLEEGVDPAELEELATLSERVRQLDDRSWNSIAAVA